METTQESLQKIIPASEVTCTLVGKCMPKKHATDFATGRYCHTCNNNGKYIDYSGINEYEFMEDDI